MTDKGLVRRDVRERAHRYAPTLPRERTEQQMVGDLLDRAFGGSASRLVMRALSSRQATPEELERIRTLLDEIEGEKR
jgi:predicted transcriptional regulator